MGKKKSTLKISNSELCRLYIYIQGHLLLMLEDFQLLKRKMKKISISLT